MADEILDALKTMDAGDVVSSKLASCYIVTGGNRYLPFQAKLSKLRKTKKSGKLFWSRIGAGNQHPLGNAVVWPFLLQHGLIWQNGWKILENRCWYILWHASSQSWSNF